MYGVYIHTQGERGERRKREGDSSLFKISSKIIKLAFEQTNLHVERPKIRAAQYMTKINV